MPFVFDPSGSAVLPDEIEVEEITEEEPIQPVQVDRSAAEEAKRRHREAHKDVKWTELDDVIEKAREEREFEKATEPDERYEGEDRPPVEIRERERRPYGGAKGLVRR